MDRPILDGASDMLASIREQRRIAHETARQWKRANELVTLWREQSDTGLTGASALGEAHRRRLVGELYADCPQALRVLRQESLDRCRMALDIVRGMREQEIARYSHA